jgi:hypothetical protein
MDFCAEYTLYSLDPKGRLIRNSSERGIAITASGLISLQRAGIITYSDKKVRIISELPEKLGYLEPLYRSLDTGKNVKMTSLFEQYAMGITDRDYIELFNSIGAELELGGLVQTTKGGFTGRRLVFIPNTEIFSRISEDIMGQLLLDSEADLMTLSIAYLSYKSRLLREHFEQKTVRALKKRLVEVKDDPESLLGSEDAEEFRQMVELIAGVPVISANL